MAALSNWRIAAVVAVLGLPAGPAVAATDTVYEYHIEHARYGNIGTYVNVVTQSDDKAVVETELHVAVKLLGVVMFREEGTRTEHWDHNRLVKFDSVTETNGTRVQVHGEAQGDSFVVTTPSGTITAPANVHPSNPWQEGMLDTDTMMSTKSGRVEKVSVSGGRVATVKLDGKDYQLRQYEVVGTKREFVWLDDRGVAVAFRTEEDGSPVDFVLTRPPQASRADSRANNNN